MGLYDGLQDAILAFTDGILQGNHSRGIFRGMASSGLSSQTLEGFRSNAFVMEANVAKALTVGEGIVDAGSTGGETLRTQFLPHGLDRATAAQEDATLMKIIAKGDASSTTIEQTLLLGLGAVNDGSTGELGWDGQGNLPSTDDTFVRISKNIKYMFEGRTSGFIAEAVGRAGGLISQVMPLLELNAMTAMVLKANMNCYRNGSSRVNINAVDGFTEQVRQYAVTNPNRQGACFDMGGTFCTKESLRAVQAAALGNFMRPNIAMVDYTTKADIQSVLYPQDRTNPDGGGNNISHERNIIGGEYETKMVTDLIGLSPNMPLAPDGPRRDGLPVATKDANGVDFSTTPWNGCNLVSPGLGSFLNNADGTNNATSLVTVPALPSGAGNQACRLPIGMDRYYAVAPIYAGMEGRPWAHGSATINTLGDATPIWLTAGDVVAMEFLPTSLTLPTGYSASSQGYRIYACDVVHNAAAPTNFNQFSYLASTGNPTTGNSWYYDNGVDIPGCWTAYFIAEKKNGVKMVEYMQLLPMIKRMLPHAALLDPFVILMFAAPIAWLPYAITEVRNIARFTG
jgi:hypothetical protein